MTELSPYLNFDGNTAEAMAFYHSVFGGDLQVTTFGDSGVEGMPADGVMHASLRTPALMFMASDAMPPQPLERGNAMSMSLTGAAGDGEELRGYWEKLADGGTVDIPLQRQMWGDDFGMLTDRFGVAWMVNIGGEPQA